MPDKSPAYQRPEQHGHDSHLGDPTDKLNELKNKLKYEQGKIDKLSKQVNDLQTDIQGLDAMVNEVRSALGSYGQAVQGLDRQRNDFVYFYEQKSKMVAAAIGEKKEPIEKLVNEFNHELHEAAEKVEDLGKQSGEAAEAYSGAAATVDEKQKAYDKLKNYQQSLQNKLQELKTLKDQITAVDDADDIGSMFFLIHEFKNVLDHTHVPQQHELARKLNEALAELEQAKEDARSAKAKSDALKLEYDDEKKKYEARRTSRRADLLSLIQKLYPKPSAVPPASTSQIA